MSDEHEISLVNHPLPPATATELEQQIDTSSALAVIVSFQTFFGMCFLVGTFVLFLIKERATKAKHIQVTEAIVANLQAGGSSHMHVHVHV